MGKREVFYALVLLAMAYWLLHKNKKIQERQAKVFQRELVAIRKARKGDRSGRSR